MGSRRARKPVAVAVTRRQRDELERLAASGDRRQALRARIVLGAAEGRSNRELAEGLGCSEPTVSVWRGRFAEHGVAGLADARDASAGAVRRGPKLPPATVSGDERQVLERVDAAAHRIAGVGAARQDRAGRRRG